MTVLRAALLGLAVFLGPALAHPADELVQAAYLKLGASGVELELDLTPGEKVAAEMLELLDRNQDGQLDSAEGQAYAQNLLQQLSLKLDGRPVALKLDSMFLPEVKVLRLGGGMMQLKATAELSAGPGQHTLEFTNAHAPVKSGYLANVFVEEQGLRVTQQQRNPEQSQYQVEYILAGQSNAWLGIGLGFLALATTAVIGLRFTQPKKTANPVD